MPSIKDFLEMMSTSWQVALGLLFASSGLLVADQYSVSYLASLPTFLPGAAFIIALCSGSVLLVATVRGLVRLIKKPFQRRRLIAMQSRHAEAVHDLSDAEKWILAWALANRTQVISANFFDATIKALIARDYLIVPPGPHRSDETPLRIPDHVWAVLKRDLQNEDLSSLVGVNPFRRW
jgi:hypothetical protein